MRDLAKGEQLLERLGGRCPDTLELLQLDVTDPHSLAAAVRCMRGQHPDVLGTASPLEHSRERVPIWGWAWMALQPWGWVCWGTERRIGAGFPRPRIQTVLGLMRHLLTSTVPHSVQRGGGLDGPPGDVLGAGHESSVRGERLRHRTHHSGLSARHEAPPRRAHPRVQQRRGAARGALQCRVLRQQVRAGRAVREPGHRSAALQHPHDAGGVRPGAHRLHGQRAARRPRGPRAAGAGR
uniref:Uncharacterized protein n=1 Tax=Chrysolophus pictus TaxID=9089 RepID=A0A8C3L9K5_CHRPC